MFKKILVPLDGSENAEHALPWARRYAAPDRAQVVLLRVPERVLTEPGPPWRPGLSEAREYLQRMARELNYAGIPGKFLTPLGRTAETIVRAARREKCDLVIMTTRGGSPVGRWLVGGVTEQVLRLSSVPVLVVRSQMPLRRQGHGRRVVAPLDGSRLAESVLPWAEGLARYHGVPLVLLHVDWRYTRGRGIPPHASEWAMRRIRQLAQEIRRRRVKVLVRLEYGDPATGILDNVSETDVVAMTTHGHGGFKRWIFGSVAEKVIHAAAIPVFVYKHGVRLTHREHATRKTAMAASE